jgi:hypothetical protein
VLHYYFSDKIELITYCVRQYKAECVTRYDSIVATADSPHELRQGLGAVMAGTYSDLAGAPPTVSPSVAYAIFDGIFQHALIRHLGGSQTAADDLRANTERILPSQVIPG